MTNNLSVSLAEAFSSLWFKSWGHTKTKTRETERGSERDRERGGGGKRETGEGERHTERARDAKNESMNKVEELMYR